MAKPGDFELIYCNIISPRGTLNLTEGFMSARIYESIMNPSIIIELDVWDTDDAMGNLRVVGDEIINISFCAPGTQILSYRFVLDKVELLDVPGTQKGKEWIAHGVGQEALQAKANYIQKAYETTVSSIVADIHKNYLHSISPLNVETTDGTVKIIIPNIKPFEAIDLVRRRAVSSANPSSTYLYFQNAYGHEFVTIEGMLKGIPIKTFYHEDGIGASVFLNDYNQIIAYQVPQIASSTVRINMGGLKQLISTYDVRTNQYSNTIVTPNYGNFNSSIFRANYGATPGQWSFIPQDSVTNPTRIAIATAYQMAFMSALTQISMHLKVNGDTTYTVGNIITLNIPEAIAITGVPPLDPEYSGNYLISRLCRNIAKIQEKPRYTDTIEAVTIDLATGV